MDKASAPEQISYTRQLDKGFRLLWFQPDIEEKFRSSFANKTHSRTMVGLGIGLAMVFSFVAIDVSGKGYLSASPAVWLISLLIVPGLMACIAIGAHHHFRQYLSNASGMLIGAIGVGIVLATIESRRIGGHFPYEVLMTLAVYTYFLIGLTFYRAFFCAVLAISTYAAAGFSGAYNTPDFHYDLFFVVSVYALGGWGCYISEYAERRDYLQRQILSDLAERDTLTGVANRRSLEQHLALVWREAEREKRCVAVVMADIDHFKGYNDNYGHPAGDECLKKVATAMASQFRRPLDLLARYGGEEFAGVWHNVTYEQALEKAEALRAAVEDLNVIHEHSSASKYVTVSIGVVVIYPNSRRGGPKVAIEQADQALYGGKKGGRNRAQVVSRIPENHAAIDPDDSNALTG